MIDVEVPYQFDVLPWDLFQNSPFVQQYYFQTSQLLNVYPELEFEYNIQKLLENRKGFGSENRKILVDAFQKTIKIPVHSKVNENLKSLLADTAVTVTTGQQIHPFLGPWLVVYKIVSAIRLAQHYQQLYTNHQFIPVFWMASEDHDVEEVRKWKIGNQEFSAQWPQNQITDNLPTQEILNQIGPLQLANANQFVLDFIDHCHHEKYLSQAIANLIYQYFGEHGILVLNPNQKNLKIMAKGMFLYDLLEGGFEKPLQENKEKLKSIGLKPPIGTRRQNCFFISTNLSRHRIDYNSQTTTFEIDDAKPLFNQDCAEEWITENITQLSANALLRPVYQETILPNIAYIGGMGELAYWTQSQALIRKLYGFAPVFRLRDSYTLIDNKTNAWLQKREFSATELLGKKKKEIEEWYINKKLESIGIQDAQYNVEKSINFVNNVLYRSKSDDLAQLKKLGAEYAQKTKASMEAIRMKWLENTENQIELEKLMKLWESDFNVEKPQDKMKYITEFPNISIKLLINQLVRRLPVVETGQNCYVVV